MKKYRVGVAALVHDHVWGELRHWNSLESVELVAVGDVNAHLVERAQKDYNIASGYSSWQEMLEAEGDSLDIVQIASENSVHADIVEACAARKLHVITEKPMAATLAQAERMVQAASEAGIVLLVNWPTAWMPAWQEMERRILSGDIGDLRYFKYRSAHNGPKEIGCAPEFYTWLYDGELNGAGALMDYCCYGAAMCARFLGQPQRVTGLRGVLVKDYPLPDDNAIIAMQFAHAMGVCEASWTQVTGYITANPQAYGSEGAMALQDGKLLLRRPKGGVETIDPPPTQAPRRNGPEYLLHCIETGEAVEGVCAMDVSRLAQEILEAGLRSSDTGQTQSLPLTV
jgi:predicted dehydrogenase